MLLPCSTWDWLSCLVLMGHGVGHLSQLRKPGRLPDTALPTLQNGAAVTDLAWDPFDPHHLAVGKEAGRLGLRVGTGSGVLSVLGSQGSWAQQ